MKKRFYISDKELARIGKKVYENEPVYLMDIILCEPLNKEELEELENHITYFVATKDEPSTVNKNMQEFIKKADKQLKQFEKISNELKKIKERYLK